MSRTSIPPQLVKVVLERDQHRCVLGFPGCTLVAVLADHRATRGMGGSKLLNDARVLVAACTSCNGRKEPVHRRLAESRGLTIRHGRTVHDTLQACEDTPVVYPDGRSWFLAADGTRTERRAA